MIESYTISFFGHRRIDNTIEFEKRLEKILIDIVLKKEYVEFLIGRDGDFDIITSSVIKRVIRNYGHNNTAFVLVLPYNKAEFFKNEHSFLNYYDEVEICSESAKAHYKAAFQIRNRNMVDRSDLIVCCIQHNYGGAYKTIEYAMKKDKEIINLADIHT